MKQFGCACVPTDKTNSTRVIKIDDYKLWLSYHLQKAADLALRPKVMAIYENANLLLEKVKLDLSVKEEEFARQLLATRAIPSPKLLIKDHKTISEKRIPNQVGHPRDKLYHDLLQYRLPRNQEMLGQGKSELFTKFHRPGL